MPFRPFTLTTAITVVLVGCPATKPLTGSTPTALIVVDTNRDGVLDLTGKTDDTGRDSFDAQHGAVVLANIDDDDSKGQPDSSDMIVNGDADTQDLSPMAIRPWSSVPAGTTALLSVDSASASNVHLFRVNGSADSAANYTVVEDPANVALTTADLKSGANFGVEAIGVVSSDASDAWSGHIRFTLTVTDSSGKVKITDAAQLRVAPVLFQYNTAPTETVFYTTGAGSDTTLLKNGIQAVWSSSKMKGLNLGNDFDQWAQDFFDVAYMSRPGPGGAFIGMKIIIRSAEPDRPAGGDVLKQMLGPDVGTIYIHGDQDANTDGYSMNSFGDWDVIPPYTNGGTDYPLGRNIWGMGTTPDEQPNQAYQSFVRAQAVQPAVNIDSSWLLVGHVDEFFSWVKSNTPRGWVMLVASPSMAKDMLNSISNDGHGGQMLFSGLSTFDYNSPPIDQFGDYATIDAQISVDDLLADSDTMMESQQAQIAIDDAVDIMKTEVGLTDDEILPMPFLYGLTFGKGLAYQPGTVNLLHIDGNIAVPKPFGPMISGADPFETDITTRLGALGLNISFVDDWDLYHIEMGEVHCGTNVARNMQLPWWESGR